MTKNHVSRRFHLIKKPQHSRFKLPAELRTRNESGKIHKIYFASAESVRNISRDYLLRKRFCNRGFSDTGLTYEAGIVLLPAAKYLYDAGKIAFSAYDPVRERPNAPSRSDSDNKYLDTCAPSAFSRFPSPYRLYGLLMSPAYCL